MSLFSNKFEFNKYKELANHEIMNKLFIVSVVYHK